MDLSGLVSTVQASGGFMVLPEDNKHITQLKSSQTGVLTP